MGDRYTRKDADKAFARLCEATGRRSSTFTNHKAGDWYLDYNAYYGGCVIEEYLTDEPEGSGITHPLGSTRRSPREFVQCVNFALAVKALPEV